MIKPIGKVNIVLENKKVKINFKFTVEKTNTKPIMCLLDSKRLKYVDKGNLNSNVNTIDNVKDKEKEKFVSKHSDVFTGMGTFPDEITIKQKCNA